MTSSDQEQQARGERGPARHEGKRSVQAGQPSSSSGGGQPAGAEATDAARQYAQEQGIDLNQVRGSGAGGQITKPDVERAVSERGSG